MLALSGLVALSLSGIAAAKCEVDNTGGDTTIDSSCTSSDVSNLRRSVDLQASAGVLLVAEDGTGNLSNQITVASCHDSGSSGYYGDTSGGSVQENPDYDAATNCASGQTYSDISS
jgi:hypothetical protein